VKLEAHSRSGRRVGTSRGRSEMLGFLERLRIHPLWLYLQVETFLWELHRSRRWVLERRHVSSHTIISAVILLMCPHTTIYLSSQAGLQ
jgi:hypothetical protein